MHEQAARDLVLAWAIESSAAEQTPGPAAQAHTRPANHQGQPERLLAEHAARVLHGAGAQHPAVATFVARNQGLFALAMAVPVAAFLLGLLVDRIGSPQRVDLLSAPLLLIVLWNLLVYAWLAAAAVLPPKRRPDAGQGWLARWSAGLAWVPHKLPPPWPAALATFTTHWLHTSAPLARVRALRALHACAAALALGAVASLYARGLLVQYQVGWESTFLQAEQVYGLLSLVFKPAMLVLGVPGFSLADVQALQWPQQAPAGGGARWVHLYAATLLLLVVLPRGVLALVAYTQERRLARRFRADPAHPYVRNLLNAAGLGAGGRAGAVLRVFPYSFTLDSPRVAGLHALARAQWGAQAQLELQTNTPYGEDPPQAGATGALVVALFNLSATPEAENHGAFLHRLVQQGPAQLEVWVDASGYEQRLAAQSGSTERIAQRSALWHSLGTAHRLPVRTVHLLQPEASLSAQHVALGCPVVLA